MKKYLLSSFISILCIHSFGLAQTGPGGVGTNDGTSSLVLWLDANTMTGTNGSVLNSWGDNSGNNFDLSAGNGATFMSAAINGYPAFNFNGTSQYFERPFTAAITPASFTVFSATRVTATNRYKAVISNRDDPGGRPTAGFILYATPNSNIWQFWTGRASGPWQVNSSGVSTAGNWASQMIEYQNAANGKRLAVNGTINSTSSHVMTSNPSRPIRVGAGRNEGTPNYYFSGDIGEVIMFNTVINDAQKIIIHNYLAAKYNFALSVNDVFNEDNATAGNYDHDVAGIGRISATHLHTDAQGTGIVRVLNPTNLGNNEFFMWGHDNAALEFNTTADIPGGIRTRLDRVWRISESNTGGTAIDVGAIDLRFDLSGIPAATAANLRLIIDTDNDGTFSDELPIGNATAIGSGVFSFAGINQFTDNTRFTLGLGITTIITNRKITFRVRNN